MTEPLTRSDVSQACNRVDFPSGFETTTDAERVQWAARRAIAALDRLTLECNIASARRSAGISQRTADRERELIKTLSKQRGRANG